jgi:hypothetical protein
MNIVSALVGFLIGTATGAAGQYFADKYTDQRREQKEAKDHARLWQDIEQRFPAVIAEMRSDFSPQENRHVRVFFVPESNTTLGFVSEPCFEYHTDKHPELRAAVALLEQHGFISDITPGNCPMYRVKEKLVDALLRSNNSCMDSPVNP